MVLTHLCQLICSDRYEVHKQIQSLSSDRPLQWQAARECLSDTVTPWKINGWNLEITHETKGKRSEPNLHEDMFHVYLQGCIVMGRWWMILGIQDLVKVKISWTLSPPPQKKYLSVMISDRLSSPLRHKFGVFCRCFGYPNVSLDSQFC